MTNGRPPRADEDGVLLLSFLGNTAANADRPILWRPGNGGPQQVTTSQRARMFLAALAPADLRADGRAVAYPTLNTDATFRRMQYGHRSAPSLALKDLRESLAIGGVDAEHHFKPGRNRWGLRDVRIDFVEVLAAGDDPGRLAGVLHEWNLRPVGLGLADDNERFFSLSVRSRLRELLEQARPRKTDEEVTLSDGRTGGEPPVPQHAKSEEDTMTNRRRPTRAVVGGVSAAIVVVVVVVVVIVFTGHHPGRPASLIRRETTGSPAHTVRDPSNAGGGYGTMLAGGQTVDIDCRLLGFKVKDGDRWWYRLASAPWSGHYYATADAFYNNGHHTGSLIGTPKLDSRVPLCSRM